MRGEIVATNAEGRIVERGGDTFGTVAYIEQMLLMYAARGGRATFYTRDGLDRAEIDPGETRVRWRARNHHADPWYGKTLDADYYEPCPDCRADRAEARGGRCDPRPDC